MYSGGSKTTLESKFTEIENTYRQYADKSNLNTTRLTSAQVNVLTTERPKIKAIVEEKRLALNTRKNELEDEEMAKNIFGRVQPSMCCLRK